ncbi:protein BONZAI 3 [Citrus sinensis]|uniref:Protein BONZAI 3 n=1 Tax=Citrus sinensis TaxID=2711 RepID=A0ACB8KJT3_CITSI|nr:protein BONZAI 3 [Citrus sinensis]
MGLCLSGSDVRGGKQAIGGAHLRPTSTADQNNVSGQNDAVDFFFKSRGLHALFTQIELSLSASKLRDLDIASKSDPMAVVYAKKRDGRLEEIGRTEVIMNNLNPAWIGKISIAFQFEIVQPLLFRVYDVDTKYHNIPVKMLKLEDQDFLGEASCVLSEIVTKQNRTLTLKLHNNYGLRVSRNFGTLSVHAEETVASKSAVEIAFRCSHLQNVDLFSKSDPFLRISRIVESGNSVPIYKTEKSVGDLEKLHQERTGATFMLPSTQRGHDKVLKSQLFVEKFVEKEQYSFLDYISSGFELNFMVAVDFTASNGNPRNPNSLHYIDPSGRLNSYQQAITEIGEVIQFYDSDRRFPAWGFGGKTFDGTVSHCFNLNGRAGGFEVGVDGVEGIMAAYASALNNVALAGPTLFGQVINTAARIAGQSLSYDRSKYFVLLIITDGVLTDLQETKDALVRASDLPLSILIVGVGGADFTQMEILDADNGRRLESSTDRVATRDIVQFVPMREVHSGQISVVQALLEELPGQFLTYMRCRDIKPLNVQMAQTCA